MGLISDLAASTANVAIKESAVEKAKSPRKLVGMVHSLRAMRDAILHRPPNVRKGRMATAH